MAIIQYDLSVFSKKDMVCLVVCYLYCIESMGMGCCGRLGLSRVRYTGFVVIYTFFAVRW